jgi:hypothetical protein
VKQIAGQPVIPGAGRQPSEWPHEWANAQGGRDGNQFGDHPDVQGAPGDQRAQSVQDKPPVLDTQAMMHRLKEEVFPDGDWQGFMDPDIRDFFDELFLATGLVRSAVIRDANISRTYGYQIMDGTRIGKRDYYLSIAFAMHLDLRTTQRMLAVTATGSLHALIKRDAAIIFAINHGYDTIRLYEFLSELSLPPLDTGIEGA